MLLKINLWKICERIVKMYKCKCYYINIGSKRIRKFSLIYIESTVNDIELNLSLLSITVN